MNKISNITNVKKTITNLKHKSISRTKKIKKSKVKTKAKAKVGGKPNVYYTLTEVAKHNKKSDAWMIINNKVYDVTEWIPNHPGGNIILKGIGKDATYMFENLHKHGVYANKILKKYYIGKLKQ
jgi:cytochrome b involved in lipid metabolism